MSRKMTIQEYLWIVMEEMVKCNSGICSKQKFALHPLIHTSPPKTLAQDSGVGQKGVDSLKMVSAVSSQSG